MSTCCNPTGLCQLVVDVTALDKPCQMTKRTWYITIFDCDGNVFEYDGRRYVVMPAKSGHISIWLPAGCYYVSGVWNFSVIPSGGYQCNHFTDRAIVSLNCGNRTCVKLYNPKAHRCGQILLKAAADLVAQNTPGFDGTALANLQTAVQPLLDAVPLDGPLFELDPDIDAAAIERAQEPTGGGLLEGAINPEDIDETLATT